MELSVIIPVYNAEATIRRLVLMLQSELSKVDFEIILVNDSSSDGSEVICSKLAEEHANVTFISLRKNFGEHNAVMCGLNFSTGEYSVIIDDDFQNPPSEILVLLNEIKKGFDVVFSRYEKKEHHFFRNLGSKLNDRVATWLLGKPKNLYLSSFKILRKELVQEIIKYEGPSPYIDGLVLRSTNNLSTAIVRHDKRDTGRSGYTLTKLVSLYLNMFINFSVMPLRVFTILGMFMFMAGICLAGIFIWERMVHPGLTPGWASLSVIVLITSGIQSVFLGLIGEYVGKLYLLQNGRPQWVIRNVVKQKTQSE